MTPLPGSPFNFTAPAGVNSNVELLLSPGEKLLFVTNQDSNTITVLNVAINGSLSLQGGFPTTPSFAATGMAMNPAGTRLYVTTQSATVNVHSVDPSGSLTQIQAAALSTDSSAGTGIVYASLSGGDFVYVNNDAVPNTVTAFKVLTDGTLSLQSAVLTGGDGNPVGFYAARRLVTDSKNRLYALNQLGNTITVFNIDPASGNLTQVMGSPFALPSGSSSSGSLAISPDGKTLYAGTEDGHIAQYSIGAAGALSLSATGFAGIDDEIDGLVVDPTGAFVVGVLFTSQSIAVLNTATMVPVANSPFVEDVMSQPAFAAGISFNAAGTLLFVGDANSGSTVASVYSFVH